MNLGKRQAIGAKVARLVLEAEKKFPAPKSGAVKRAWVLSQARRDAPSGTGESHDFAKWIGAALLRIALEAAVAILNEVLKKQPA
jgi:hypothetical protein